MLGAFRVSVWGDLANQSTGGPGIIPVVGDAMDLAIGATLAFVIMDLLPKVGQGKLVERCSYP